MSQEVLGTFGGKTERLILPDPEAEVVPGVVWGAYYALFTPAFWRTLAWLDQEDKSYQSYRIGERLEEEVAACLLGGYGIPAEVGLAAYYRVRDAGCLSLKEPASAENLLRLLSEPLKLQGRSVRYRFARQKAMYLSAALRKLSEEPPPTGDDLMFRRWLLKLKGFGPKTASWVTRNCLASDRVAILDVHLYRAGRLMGLFTKRESPASDYYEMEEKFLVFSEKLEVRPSVLDNLIWQRMKEAGNLALRVLRNVEAIEAGGEASLGEAELPL